MERYHMFKLGLAILFYAAYCIRPMLVSGLRSNSLVTNQTLRPEDYNVFYQGVDGTPGVDFPVLSYIPRTTFSCDGIDSGYYADLDTDCQVFHICEEGKKISFLCPNGTIFEQADLICEWWYKVDCVNAPNLYQESAERLRDDLARRKASRRIPLDGRERNHGAVMRIEETASVSAHRVSSSRSSRVQSAIDENVPQKRFNDADTGNFGDNQRRSSSTGTKQVYVRSTTPSSLGRGFASNLPVAPTRKQFASSSNRGSVKYSNSFGSKPGSTLKPNLDVDVDEYELQFPKHKSELVPKLADSATIKIDSDRVDLGQPKRKSGVTLTSDSDELQVPEETAAFTPNSYNRLQASSRKFASNPHPNHRPTYSDLKQPDFPSTKFVNTINSVTPQYVTTQQINNGKPYIGSTVGGRVFHRNTVRTEDPTETVNELVFSSTPKSEYSNTLPPVETTSKRTVDHATVYGSFSRGTAGTPTGRGVEVKIGKNVDKIKIQLSKSFGGTSTVAPPLGDGFVRITGSLSKPIGRVAASGGTLSTSNIGSVTLVPPHIGRFQSTTGRPELYETSTLRSFEIGGGTGSGGSNTVDEDTGLGSGYNGRVTFADTGSTATPNVQISTQFPFGATKTAVPKVVTNLLGRSQAAVGSGSVSILPIATVSHDSGTGTSSSGSQSTTGGLGSNVVPNGSVSISPESAIGAVSTQDIGSTSAPYLVSSPTSTTTFTVDDLGGKESTYASVGSTVPPIVQLGTNTIKPNVPGFRAGSNLLGRTQAAVSGGSTLSTLLLPVGDGNTVGSSEQLSTPSSVSVNPESNIGVVIESTSGSYTGSTSGTASNADGTNQAYGTGSTLGGKQSTYDGSTVAPQLSFDTTNIPGSRPGSNVPRRSQAAISGGSTVSTLLPLPVGAASTNDFDAFGSTAAPSRPDSISINNIGGVNTQGIGSTSEPNLPASPSGTASNADGTNQAVYGTRTNLSGKPSYDDTSSSVGSTVAPHGQVAFDANIPGSGASSNLPGRGQATVFGRSTVTTLLPLPAGAAASSYGSSSVIGSTVVPSGRFSTLRSVSTGGGSGGYGYSTTNPVESGTRTTPAPYLPLGSTTEGTRNVGGGDKAIYDATGTQSGDFGTIPSEQFSTITPVVISEGSINAFSTSKPLRGAGSIGNDLSSTVVPDFQYSTHASKDNTIGTGTAQGPLDVNQSSTSDFGSTVPPNVQFAFTGDNNLVSTASPRVTTLKPDVYINDYSRNTVSSPFGNVFGQPGSSTIPPLQATRPNRTDASSNSFRQNFYPTRSKPIAPFTPIVVPDLTENDIGSTFSPIGSVSPLGDEPAATFSTGFFITRNSVYGSTTPTPFGLSKATPAAYSPSLLVNVSPNSGEGTGTQPTRATTKDSYLIRSETKWPRPFQKTNAIDDATTTNAVTPTYLTYQISSARPFELPKDKATIAPTVPTPFTTARSVQANVDNMINALRETLGSQDYSSETPRPGLVIPPSAGPQTLHTLAQYFANALDGIVADQEKETGEELDEESKEKLTSLLTQMTMYRYNQLFKDTEGGVETTTPPIEELQGDDSNNLVETPELRQLARNFSLALSSYLNDPDGFRKELETFRPTEPPVTDDEIAAAADEELLNFSDADSKPLVPTPQAPAPTWGYILAPKLNTDDDVKNSLNPDLYAADTQSFVPGYNSVVGQSKDDLPGDHWTTSSGVTKLWQSALSINPKVLNENLGSASTRAISRTTEAYSIGGGPTPPGVLQSEITYDLRALPRLSLNSSRVHGILIDFVNTTRPDDSNRLQRLLRKLNTTQDEFIHKMKEIETNPLTKRLILLLISECGANVTKGLEKDPIESLSEVLNSSSSSSSNTAVSASRGVQGNSDIPELVDPSLQADDQDTRALQLLNSLYSIASKFGK